SDATVPLRRLLRSSSEPRCTSAPAAASDLALASERARPRTWCPASINSSTIAEPMNPVAPVTKTRILIFFKIPARDQAGEACLRELASQLPRREHRHPRAHAGGSRRRLLGRN